MCVSVCVCSCSVKCPPFAAPFEILRLSLVKQDSGGALKVQSCDRMVLPARDIATREVLASRTFVTCDEETLFCHGIRAH